MARSRGTSPKYAWIAGELRKQIRSRELRLGDLVATEQGLQRDFGCSRGTVRRALDTLVQEGLIRSRPGAGYFLAREGNGDREPFFGLIQPNILNAQLLRISQRFSLEASRLGYRVVLGVIDEQPTVEREFIDDLHQLRASGLLKFPTTVPAEAALRAHLRAIGMPYVIVNDFWTDAANDNSVTFDEVEAVTAAVGHLRELGHERIGWLDGADGPRERAIEAFRAALARHGLAFGEHQVLLCPPYASPPVAEFRARWDAAPTAMVTPYDGMAMRLVEALGRAGLRVPDDVSVVNLNGPPLYSTSGLEMTTAVPPVEQIVAKAIEILSNPEHAQAVCHYRFRPEFHVGRTTAPPPAESSELRFQSSGTAHGQRHGSGTRTTSRLPFPEP